MKRTSFVAIAFSVVFSGCVSSASRPDYPTDLLTITVDVGRNDDGKLIDSILEFSHYVILDPQQEVLIGKIKKLQLLDGHIGVASENKAYVFDSTGRLVHCWDRQGRGPNEYLQMTDMEIAREKDWVCHVYDKNAGKLLTYDMDDKAVSVKEMIPHAKAFKLLGDGLIAFNMGNGSSTFLQKEDYFNYRCIDSFGKTRISAVPFNKQMFGLSTQYDKGKSFFYRYGEQIYMSAQHNDTIYQVSDTSGWITPCLVFDLGVERPRADDENYPISNYQKGLGGEKPEVPVAFYKFPNGYLAEYTYDFRPYVLIANEQGEILYTGNSARDKNGVLLRPVPYLDFDNSGYLISYFSPVNIEADKKIGRRKGCDSALLDELSLKVSENSNPVLLFYKWIY